MTINRNDNFVGAILFQAVQKRDELAGAQRVGLSIAITVIALPVGIAALVVGVAQEILTWVLWPLSHYSDSVKHVYVLLSNKPLTATVLSIVLAVKSFFQAFFMDIFSKQCILAEFTAPHLEDPALETGPTLRKFLVKNEAKDLMQTTLTQLFSEGPLKDNASFLPNLEALVSALSPLFKAAQPQAMHLTRKLPELILILGELSEQDKKSLKKNLVDFVWNNTTIMEKIELAGSGITLELLLDYKNPEKMDLKQILPTALRIIQRLSTLEDHKFAVFSTELQKPLKECLKILGSLNQENLHVTTATAIKNCLEILNTPPTKKENAIHINGITNELTKHPEILDSLGREFVASFLNKKISSNRNQLSQLQSKLNKLNAQARRFNHTDSLTYNEILEGIKQVSESLNRYNLINKWIPSLWEIIPLLDQDSITSCQSLIRNLLSQDPTTNNPTSEANIHLLSSLLPFLVKNISHVYYQPIVDYLDCTINTVAKQINEYTTEEEKTALNEKIKQLTLTKNLIPYIWKLIPVLNQNEAQSCQTLIKNLLSSSSEKTNLRSEENLNLLIDILPLLKGLSDQESETLFEHFLRFADLPQLKEKEQVCSKALNLVLYFFLEYFAEEPNRKILIEFLQKPNQDTFANLIIELSKNDRAVQNLTFMKSSIIELIDLFIEDATFKQSLKAVIDSMTQVDMSIALKLVAELMPHIIPILKENIDFEPFLTVLKDEISNHKAKLLYYAVSFNAVRNLATQYSQLFLSKLPFSKTPVSVNWTQIISKANIENCLPFIIEKITEIHKTYDYTQLKIKDLSNSGFEVVKLDDLEKDPEIKRIPDHIQAHINDVFKFLEEMNKPNQKQDIDRINLLKKVISTVRNALIQMDPSNLISKKKEVHLNS